MYNNMDVLVLCFVWMKVLVLVFICVDKYGDGFWILFCCKSSLVRGIVSVFGRCS